MSNIVQKEIDKYVARTQGSHKRQKEAEKVLPGGSSRGTAYFEPYPHFIESGHDHYIVDVDGNEYLDFMINATSLILGHANANEIGRHTSELQSRVQLVCRLLLEKKKNKHPRSDIGLPH